MDPNCPSTMTMGYCAPGLECERAPQFPERPGNCVKQPVARTSTEGINHKISK